MFDPNIFVLDVNHIICTWNINLLWYVGTRIPMLPGDHVMLINLNLTIN